MSRLLMTIIVLGAIVAVVGFYRGWFQFSSEDAGSTSNVTLTVDKDRMKADETKVEQKAEAVGYKVKEKATAAKDAASPTTVPAAPAGTVN